MPTHPLKQRRSSSAAPLYSPTKRDMTSSTPAQGRGLRRRLRLAHERHRAQVRAAARSLPKDYSKFEPSVLENLLRIFDKGNSARRRTCQDRAVVVGGV